MSGATSGGDSGGLVREVFASDVLKDNPLDDPSVRDLWVWLPAEYELDSTRRFPVLFVLTGFTGRGRMALNDNPWAPGLDARMDRIVASGDGEPAILVFPDCFTRLGGSQYLNSIALGRYEDYVVDELVPFVDERFRTLGAGHRGVFGKSSGGYGALRLTMRRPGVFAAAASHSGDLCFELCYAPDFPAVARTLTKAGGVDGFLADFAKGEKKRSEQVQALNILAMSAAYSPHAEAKGPTSFDLPFDVHDLSLDLAAWGRWLENDPLRMVEAAAAQDALRSLRCLYIDAGTRDQFNLDFGARRFVHRLEELEIPCEYEEFDDDHFSISYRYERSIPRLTRALGPA